MAEQQQNIKSPAKEKPDIEYPDVVHDHTQQILEHKSSTHHNIEVNKEKIIEECDENNQQAKKHLPHLKFDEQKEANIGIKSLGVRDLQSPQQHGIEDEIKPKDTLIEEDNEDEMSNSKKKLHHLQFDESQGKSIDIQFQGKITDNCSPRAKSQSMQNYLNEIKEEDDNNQPRRPKNLSEINKFHDSLSKIEKEISTLEKDTKNSPLKKLKKQKSCEIRESIEENDDELVEEKSNIIDHQIQHKPSKLGGTLKKLEKEINPGQDDIDIIQQQQHDMTKSISNKLSNSREAIVEEEKVEEE